MKRSIISTIIILILLLLAIGCGENSSLSSTKNRANEIKVNVSFKKNYSKNSLYQKTTDISKILLDINNSNGVVYQNKEFSKNSSGWGVNLILNKDNSPFTFITKAYDGGNTLIYKGETTKTLTDTDNNVTLELVAVTDRDRGTLPSIKSVDISTTNSVTKVAFTILNSMGGDIEYQLPTTGEFESSSGTLTFGQGESEKILTVNYTKPTDTQNGLDYTISLKNNRGDTVITTFTIDGNNITLNMPPNINDIVVEDNSDRFTITADITDEDSSSWSFLWTVLEGGVTVTSGDTTSNPLELEGYNGTDAIQIKLSVTDDEGANSTVTYWLRGGEDSTPVDTSSLRKTGQTKSYDVDGNEVTDGSIKDDGFYETGITPSYSRDDSKEIVTDNITGLMWQDNSEAKTVTKAWVTQANYDAGNYNNTSGDTATTYCSQLILGDFDDWRLPTIEEFMKIPNRSRREPAIDESKFKNIDSSNGYWSADTSQSYSNVAWLVSFQTGRDSWAVKYVNNRHVRCVRQPNNYQKITPSYSRSNGIVIDSSTNLMWQDDYNDNANLVKQATWMEAIDYCEALTLGGYKNWRLPNFNELYFIADRSKEEPAIDTTKFQNTQTQGLFYWSSSSYTSEYSQYAWCVYFDNGTSQGDKKSDNNYVRCVHSLNN